jgi:hypothetical protein
VEEDKQHYLKEERKVRDRIRKEASNYSNKPISSIGYNSN